MKFARIVPTTLALLAALAVTGTWAAPSTEAAARQRLQRDNAACMRVTLPDARANCLSEASTRFAATQPTPPSESPEALARNALKRCEPLPTELRMDCEARMRGAGTQSGSVEGGGIYRELVTRIVEPEPTDAVRMQ